MGIELCPSHFSTFPALAKKVSLSQELLIESRQERTGGGGGGGGSLSRLYHFPHSPDVCVPHKMNDGFRAMDGPPPLCRKDTADYFLSSLATIEQDRRKSLTLQLGCTVLPWAKEKVWDITIWVAIDRRGTSEAGTD